MYKVLLEKVAGLFLLGNADEALYRGHERGHHALVELLHGSNVLLLFGTLHGAAKQEINEVGEVLLVALYNCGERAAACKVIAVRAEKGMRLRTGESELKGRTGFLRNAGQRVSWHVKLVVVEFEQRQLDALEVTDLDGRAGKK